MNDEGNPCIADFGLSRVEALQASLSGTSGARGSLRWQAPELLLPETYRGNGKHTSKTDIYAFGMTCLEVNAIARRQTNVSQYFLRFIQEISHLMS